MEIEKWPIDKVKPYKYNPRNNDDAVEATANSIKEFGWQQPIVVDKGGVVVAGHTRLRAAKKLKLDKVPVVVANALSDEQVKAYRLADNKTSELADWNLPMLDDELKSIADLDMSDFGFDMDDDETDNVLLDNPTTSPDDFKNDFIVSPFSVINTASGDMLNHKKKWFQLIEDDGSSRGLKHPTIADKSLPGGEHMKDASIMNPAVCELICRWFLPLSQTNNIFDCFSGDPEFGFVSSYLGNKFTGIEIRKEQVEFNTKLAAKSGLNATYINDDGQNVTQHFEKSSQDLLFSCPPYFDLEVYSDLAKDASNQDNYEDFVKILANAFTGAVSRLKDGRFACIVVGDIRDKKTGYYYNFVDDIKQIFKNAGMNLYNEIILQDPIGTAPMKARRFMRSRKIVKIHQNLLVFYKGDTHNISNGFGIIEGFKKMEEDYEG